MSYILIIHIFTTFFMTGLCWFVQIVHYPLFRMINPKDFPAYEKKNLNTGFIAVPMMIIELATGLWILYDNQSLIPFLNVVLLGIIGLSTVIFQAPVHFLLKNKMSLPLINQLIKTNWIRTISWTIRSLLLISLMV